MAIAKRAAEWMGSIMAIDSYPEEAAVFANFPTMFAGLVTPEGNIEHYDGVLRFADDSGRALAEISDPRKYGNYIGEATENDSFLKSPYFKPKGYPEGIYRVGPLARLVMAEKCGTPEADAELARFRARLGRRRRAVFIITGRGWWRRFTGLR